MSKRKVVGDDDDGEEQEEEQVAGPSKRARRQEADADMELDEAMDQEEDAGELEEQEVDELEDDSGAEDADKEEARAIRDEMEENREHGGTRAEAGVVEEISLTNFMCHDRLKVKLIPQLNFILGHNGSGKSAVLTAITIALGGKAASTSRGNSLKSFVKEGRASALVELRLKNGGEDAYRPDVYGRSINIIRSIHSDGGGSWKMKSDKGITVATTRDELSSICDHHNLQVDNPLNVLSQDAARQFLSAAGDSDKYGFFLKGTRLSHLADEYEIVRKNVNRIRIISESKREVLPELRSKFNNAKSKLHTVQKVREQRDKLALFKDQYIWAQVSEAEGALQAAVGNMAQVEVKIEKQQRKLQETQATLSLQDEKIGAIEAQQNVALEREAPLNDALRGHKEELKKGVDKVRAVKAEETQLNAMFSRQRDVVKDLQSRIDEEAQRLSAGNLAKRQKLEGELRQAEHQRKEYERQMLELEDELRRVDGRMQQDLTPRMEKARQRRDQGRKRIVDLETAMQRLDAARANRITAYGPNMPQLINAINKETRWRQKPIGPVGAYVKLNDMQWSDVVESVLGNNLNAFCVTNHYDRQLLTELKQRTNNARIPIIKNEDDVFDFSQGEPDTQVLTILRALEISNDYIKRQLVNAANIEKVALVRERREGDALVRANRAVQACYTQDMFRVSGGARGSSTATVDRYRGPPRLSANLDAQLQRLRAEHEEAQQALRGVNAELQEVEAEMRQLDQRRKEIRRNMPTLKNQINELRFTAERLNEELREDEPTNVAALEQAKEEAKQELETIKGQFVEVQKRKEELELALRPFEELIAQVSGQLRTFQEERVRAEPELQLYVAARLTAQNAKQHWEEHIAQSQARLVELTALKNAAEVKVNEYTTTAAEYCEVRPETDHPSQYYQRAIEAIEKQLAQAQRSLGQSVESFEAEVQKTRHAFISIKHELDMFRKVVRQFKASLILRQTKWSFFRRTIALRSKMAFSFNLSKRGFSGFVQFDHQRQKLRLLVQTDASQNAEVDPDDPDAAQGGVNKAFAKDPTSLSGGEKSFSTICLLLSLWEAIGCPIRCLDEFDVFMDAVNRKVSMRMMIETAGASQGVQYVFITPQSMAGVTTGPGVFCQTLRDPERMEGSLAGAS